jgi:hypothetical protein
MSRNTGEIVKFSCRNVKHFKYIRDIIQYKFERFPVLYSNINDSLLFIKHVCNAADDSEIIMVESKSYFKNNSHLEDTMQYRGEEYFNVNCVLMVKEMAYRYLHLEMMFREK